MGSVEAFGVAFLDWTARRFPYMARLRLFLFIILCLVCKFRNVWYCYLWVFEAVVVSNEDCFTFSPYGHY